MQRLVLIVMSSALLFRGAPAAARRRVKCVEGLTGPPTVTRPVECDADGQTDGICTFVRCPLCRLCFPPGPVFVCDLEHPIRVPVSRSRVRGRLVLRCQAPATCDGDPQCTAVTRSCQDGMLGPPEEGRCDFDGQVDGSCTFGFFCLEVCGPEPRETVVVPVGETRVVQRPNLPGLDRTEYTLRCLP